MKRKISKGVYGMIFSLLIGFVMSLFMSFFSIVFNEGLIEGFWGIWMSRTFIGLVVGFPIAAVAVPIIQKFLDKYFTTE